MSEEERAGTRERSKYMPMFYSYIEQLSLLSAEQIGELLMALLRYGRDGTLPDFPRDSSVYMAFSFIADNSMRAEDRLHAGKSKGGRARAAGAQKDEKGRFLPSESGQGSVESVECVESVGDARRENRVFPPAGTPSTRRTSSRSPAETQHNPAESSTSSKPSYNKYKYNNKNKYNNNRLYDDVDDVVLKLVENDLAPLLESSTTVALTAKDRGELADAVRRYGQQTVEDGIMIAIDRGARTWDYTLKTIRTQAEQPGRKPEY